MYVVADLLEVGDPVKISKIGRDSYHDSVDDPHDSSGYITEFYSEDFLSVRVSWPGDKYNWYCPIQLELIS